MISLEELREVEPKFKKLSDEELTLVRQYLYSLGTLIFDRWLSERNSSKNPQMGDGPNDSCMRQ